MADDSGSITKEFPLEKLDETILAARPGMKYRELLSFARKHTHGDIPGTIKNRFLLVEKDRIVHDAFLSLVQSEGFESKRVRKIMYFEFAMRDERIREFILTRIVDQDGHWQPAEIVNKHNRVFFRRFFSINGAIKARSNFERFLVEANLFNTSGRRVDLSLEDNWLFDGMRVAAQFVDAETRATMLANPCEYLIAKGWNGLANCSVDELRAFAAGRMAVIPGIIDEEGVDVAESEPLGTDDSKEWNRKKPNLSKLPSIFTVDAVARERASTSHWQLESRLAEKLRSLEIVPMFNRSIDMHWEASGRNVLVEIKSCHSRNMLAQVRKGISQLFEYRYRYLDSLGEDALLVLFLESRPSGRREWLCDYLQSIGITVAWPGEDGAFETACDPDECVSDVFQTA